MKQLLLSLIFLHLAHAAERIPGTKVTIDPPAGFELSTDFTGYYMESIGANISVGEIPGPYAEVKKGLSKEILEKSGAKFISQKAIKIGEVDGTLTLTERTVEGEQYGQWLLVFGKDTSVVVNALVPKDDFPGLSDAIKKCLMETKWQPDLEIGMQEGLPYSIEEAGDLKCAFKIQYSLVLSRNGIHPVKTPALPMVMLNALQDEELQKDIDIKAQVRAILKQIGKLPDNMTIVEEKEITLNGLKWFQLDVTARPEDAKVDIAYRLSMAVKDKWIYMQFCRIAKKDFKEYEKTFDSILTSFKVIER